MVNLQKSDKAKVLETIKKGKSAREITRAHALNLCSKGYVPIEIADILEITPRTVINIIDNYTEGGLSKALHDDPRPGQPIRFDDGVKAKIVAIVCCDPPEGFDRWTLELLQDAAIKNKIVDSISTESIRLILHEHDIKPWQYKMWCVPFLNDEYIARMEDILDIYQKPYTASNPVVCVDEKPVPLMSDKKDRSSCYPGSPNKIDYEYGRHGSANVFCGVEPKAGRYFNRVTERKTKNDFAKFLAGIARFYKTADQITLILDNYCTHYEKSLIEFYGKEQGQKIWSRFDVHYTPIHASWLNQAEIAIGMYDRQCLGSSRIPDILLLRKKTRSWNKIINRKNVTIKWKFTKLDAKEKFDYG